MMNIASLIKKEFLPIVSSYGFRQKNKLLVKEQDGLLKGFYFDKQADDRMYVHLFIQPLYIPSNHVVLSYGWRLKGSHAYGDMFLLGESDLEFTTAEVSGLLLSHKDILLEINSASDFYSKFLTASSFKLLIPRTSTDIRYQEVVTYTLAYAYPDRACEASVKFLQLWEEDDRKHLEWMQRIKERMLAMQEVCDSPEKLKILFQERIEFTRKNLKL